MTALIPLALLLTLASSAPAGTSCTTYEEKTLNRWQTLCSDGTRAISTYNRALQQWDTTVTSPPTLTPSQRAPRGKEHRR
jgi:hypothetical protein